jgi:hypothetical protein
VCKGEFEAWVQFTQRLQWIRLFLYIFIWVASQIALETFLVLFLKHWPTTMSIASQRSEALSLYRAVLRASRMFTWKSPTGEEWSVCARFRDGLRHQACDSPQSSDQKVDRMLLTTTPRAQKLFFFFFSPVFFFLFFFQQPDVPFHSIISLQGRRSAEERARRV